MVNDDQSFVDVTWSTNIPDIVNIAVIAKSEDGIESSVVVGPDVRNAKVYIVPNTLYNITVVVFDICKQNYYNYQSLLVEDLKHRQLFYNRLQ